MDKTLPQEIRKLYMQISNLITQSISASDVPEPWKSGLSECKGQLTASLGELGDAVPTAQEPSYSMLKSSLECVHNMLCNLTEISKAKSTEIANVRASLVPEVEKAIDVKVKAGELIPKETATQLATSSRAEGVTEGLTKGRQISDRRLALATAGLPAEVIGAAPEEILLAEEPAFNGHRDKAKDRVTKLSGVGLTTASSSALKLAWAPDEEFTAQFTTFSSIHDAAKGKPNGNPPATPPSKPSGFITPSGTPAPQKRPLVLC